MQTPLRLPRLLSGETLGQAAPASTTSRSGSSPGVGSARHFSLGGWESGPGWVWRGGGGHDIPEQSANFSASSSQTGPNLSPQPHGCLAPYHGPVALTTPWSHYGLSHVLAFACAAFPAWTAPPPPITSFLSTSEPEWHRPHPPLGPLAFPLSLSSGAIGAGVACGSEFPRD